MFYKNKELFIMQNLNLNQLFNFIAKNYTITVLIEIVFGL